MTARVTVLLFGLLASAQADTLLLKDGAQVKGRWWSVDASQIHFLVDNQLQHFDRSNVSTVSFGDATLPVPPPAATTTPAGAITEPREVGAVYLRNVSGNLVALERTQAVERQRGSTQYWEMPAVRSPVRLNAAPEMQFVVRLAAGTDPESFSLYPLAAANGSRRTEPNSGRQKRPRTVEFTIAKAGESTYTLTVKGLAPGEYAFSPASSNDGYCFGVDGAAPGR